MDRYTLTDEGRARFRRVRVRMSMDGKATIGDYEVLNYLYERGAATVEEIENYTGITWEHLINKLAGFIYWGYVEKLAEQ